MLHLAVRVVGGLHVYAARMRENAERSHGLMFSQRVLLKLTGRGLPRQRAYELVQRNAMRAWRESRSFADLLAGDDEVTAVLGPGELKECFDAGWYLRNIDRIYARLGLPRHGGGA
jgi:adenylosuccinate lyase